MNIENPIINRVASSGLISLDLEDYLDQAETVEFDLAAFLDQGLILREREFRSSIKSHNWDQYLQKNIIILCSTEALIPSWAYMLIVSKLKGLVNCIAIGNKANLEKELIDQAISKINLADFNDGKVVIKGCGNIDQRDYAYTKMTELLVPIVSSLMYGEPCSTVPVYKRVQK